MNLKRAAILCVPIAARAASSSNKRHAIPPKMPATLVTDFDHTLTERDSLGALVALSPAPDLLADAEAYYLSGAAEVNKMVLDGRVDEALAELERVEGTALDMVESSGVLAGISPAAITEASSKLPFRAGARDALIGAAARGVDVHVCSTNWSRRWIEGALGDASPAVRSIACNDFVVDEGGISNGRLRRAVVGASDKERFVSSLRARGGWSVYVGDALPDLSALLSADVGVVLGENPTLRAALSTRQGPLAPLLDAPDAGGRIAPGVYKADGWPEIVSTLLCGATVSQSQPM